MAPSQFLSFFVIISFLQPFIHAQTTIISNTLPACAQSCPVLLQAQSACVPPPTGAAAVSNQQTYTSCFCQSNYLVTLKSGSSASNLCPTCSAADMSTTQQWFNGLCQQGVAPGANNNNNNNNNNNGGQQQATQPSSTLKTSSTPPASKQTGSSTAGGVTQDTSPSDQNKSWISTHYRWIIMLIVLFFGFLALALGGRYLHRRYQRRQELGGHDRTGQPDLGSWAPGQSVHEIGPPTGAVGAVAVARNEKGKQNADVQEQPIEKKRNSRRLKKLLDLRQEK